MICAMICFGPGDPGGTTSQTTLMTSLDLWPTTQRLRAFQRQEADVEVIHVDPRFGLWRQLFLALTPLIFRCFLHFNPFQTSAIFIHFNQFHPSCNQPPPQKDEQQEGSRLVAYSRDIQGDDHHKFTSTYLAPSCTILQHLAALLSSGWSDWWCCRFCPEDLHRTVWHPGPHHEKIGSYALHFVAICSLLFT